LNRGQLPVKSLKTENFRNLANQEIQLAPTANVLVGRNGSGKTSTLEAIYLATSLRSFRQVRLRDVIRQGCDWSQVEITSGDVNTPLGQRVKIHGGGRTAWLGGRLVKKVSSYVVNCLSMAFTPDDLSMIKGSPERRRNFLDRALMLHRADHLERVRAFQRVLRSRNSLLKEKRPGYREMLDSYTEQLCRLAEPLSQARRQAVEQLAPLARRAYESISGTSEEMTVTYVSGSRRQGGEKGDLYQVLQAVRTRDERLGYTSRGPQFDDLQMDIAGRDARKLASQGEQRSCALALLMAVVEWLRDMDGRLPVLLLDDVSSELDSGRRGRLFSRLLEMGNQVMLTTTDPQYASQLLAAEARLLEVDQGVIEAKR